MSPRTTFMPLPTKDPDVTYLSRLSKDKPEVFDYIAGVRLIDDYVFAIKNFGPHSRPGELDRLRKRYIEATTKCSRLLSLIERRYLPHV